MTNLFARSFKGKASLALAFWIVYVLIGFVLWLILGLIIGMAAPNMSPMTMHNLTLALLLPYIIFAAICVWRCARNSWILWNILARIAVVLGVLNGIISIIQLVR